jgi:hypothetical protein
MWYRFDAFNTEALYGWTRDPDVMRAMRDRLDRMAGEYGQYRVTALGDGDDVTDGGERRLMDRNDLILTDDTTVADIEELNEREGRHA